MRVKLNMQDVHGLFMNPWRSDPCSSPLIFQMRAILSRPAVKTSGVSVLSMYLMYLIASLCPFHYASCLK